MLKEESLISELEEMVAGIPLISTHNHHMKDEQHKQLDLEYLFDRSYVSWCSMPSGSTFGEREKWLNGVRTNSYFVWLERALDSVYGFGKITASNWDALSKRIRESHQEDGYHIRLLEKAKLIGLIEDAYWKPGSDVGHPSLIKPVYRLDMWMLGFHPEAPYPYLVQESDSPDFDTYLTRFESAIRNNPNLVGLKIAVAYHRNIKFKQVPYEDARAIFGRHPSTVSQKEIEIFGNYILHEGLRIAEELNLTVQIHTGLAKLGGSNPLFLDGLISAYPNVNFALFHGGFPWIYETAAMAHNHPNVIIDINWLPLISTTAASQILPVYIETLRDNHRITWGTDTWASEGAIGASMAFRHMLSRVLATKVLDGYFTMEEAEDFATKIMYKNAKQIYGLK